MLVLPIGLMLGLKIRLSKCLRNMLCQFNSKGIETKCSSESAFRGATPIMRLNLITLIHFNARGWPLCFFLPPFPTLPSSPLHFHLSPSLPFFFLSLFFSILLPPCWVVLHIVPCTKAAVSLIPISWQTSPQREREHTF